MLGNPESFPGLRIYAVTFDAEMTKLRGREIFGDFHVSAAR